MSQDEINKLLLNKIRNLKKSIHPRSQRWVRVLAKREIFVKKRILNVGNCLLQSNFLHTFRRSLSRRWANIIIKQKTKNILAHEGNLIKFQVFVSDRLFVSSIFRTFVTLYLNAITIISCKTNWRHNFRYEPGILQINFPHSHKHTNTCQKKERKTTKKKLKTASKYFANNLLYSNAPTPSKYNRRERNKIMYNNYTNAYAIYVSTAMWHYNSYTPDKRCAITTFTATLLQLFGLKGANECEVLCECVCVCVKQVLATSMHSHCVAVCV